ncbi:regulator of Vps4 activity in the MVB pathway-domain-containing protein [Thelephora terrestris]|uniref:Regulator of Vps4 activity in the MVB pathway-domain-containing protein n=1 Tax=Thelephora terrestris TaxID=56493 RepID=A0A9P6HQU4_9AGAM|nr:regulator of Vps4 activity in the MVB pathway-domain-containing protein [Thelephora terrestris]
MATMSWDPNRARAQFRLAAQRLAQLQEKFESQAQITKGDISTLLRQGNVGLARAKAEGVIKDEIHSDLLQTLEMYLGVVLEQFAEIEKKLIPSPPLVEAASGIIYAAPTLGIRELQTAREILIQRLGKEFARAAAGNKDRYVSSRVVRAVLAGPPSAAILDDFLSRVAKVYGIEWIPGLRSHEKLTALSELLDQGVSEIDRTELRKLCMRGLPLEPPWLRPRVWRILMGSLPLVKSKWASEALKQRESYYSLVQRLLEPFDSLPAPSTPLSSLDANLMEVGKQLSGVPPNLYAFLEEDPEWVGISPLDEDAPEEIRIPLSHNLDQRLNAINQNDSGSVGDLNATPEIRLEADDIPGTPEISVTAPENLSEETPAAPTTLVASRSFGIASNASRRHVSALVRLLYVHSCLNPAHRSPYIASLLVPLYSALNMEIEAQDVAHAEADTFWLFEAMISEFAPLEDEAEGALWMKKLGDRVWQADSEFYADLLAMGLDPSLPHYSYRWLAPLLTHTLPLPCVFMAWDVLFSYPLRERDTNPKLDGLLDVCTGMLLKSRWTLKRIANIGASGQKSPGLWDAGPQSQPGEFSEAFMEGMVFLQNYPVNVVGGMEAVLQAADDLTTRREAEVRAAQTPSTGVGARIRGAVWGFSGQPGSAVTMPANVTNESARPQEFLAGITDFTAGPSVLTSRIANTVWRGITNQSAMDEPTSPTTPSASGSPRYPFPPSPQLLAQPFSPGPLSPLVLGSRVGTPEPLAIGTNLWNYAEKLRDSDTAAKLSKASTNLRVMALDAWHKRGSPEETHDHLEQSKAQSTSDVSHIRKYSVQSEGSYFSRKHSFSDADPTYTPPPRPSHFRPPRESIFLDTSKVSSTPASPTLSAVSELSVSSTGSGRSISGGPKPLLLSTSNVIPPADEGKKIWGHIARDSVSSTSSLSPTDYRSKRRTESLSWDSDTSKSRVVPLRRGTGKMSPAAIAAKISRSRPDSTSSERSDHLGKLSEEPKPIVGAETQPSIPEEEHVNPPSPIHSSPRETLLNFVTPVSEAVHVQDVEPQRGSLMLRDVLDGNIRSSLRKKTRSTIDQEPGATISEASKIGARIKLSQRVKPRRQLPRIHTAAGASERTTGTSPNTLQLPEWPRVVEEAPTPRASDFEVAFPSSSPTRSPRSPRRPRKLSGEKETRPRKASGENREGTRPRKVSGEMRKASGGSIRHNRESSSIEGDDEGYDDLLSAYESEEGHRV